MIAGSEFQAQSRQLVYVGLPTGAAGRNGRGGRPTTSNGLDKCKRHMQWWKSTNGHQDARRPQPIYQGQAPIVLCSSSAMSVTAQDEGQAPKNFDGEAPKMRKSPERLAVINVVRTGRSATTFRSGQLIHQRAVPELFVNRGLTRSMSRSAKLRDSAAKESFFSSLKAVHTA